MNQLTRLEEERLRPQPREITVTDLLNDLIALIVSECVRHDRDGRTPRFFDEGSGNAFPRHGRQY